MTNKIFVPNLDQYSCVEVYNKDTLRGWYTTNDSQYNDVDYIYFNSHYFTETDSRRFYQEEVICQPLDNLTNEFYYRTDLSDILISLFVILVIGFGIPFYVVTAFFKRFKR